MMTIRTILRGTLCASVTFAAAAFEAAVRRDATCAMCYCGIALAYGPELKLVADSERIALARRAALEALHAVIADGDGADWERELVSALYGRYSSAPTGGAGAARDSAFASRMVQLGRRYDSPDLLALAAEARLALDAPGDWRTVHGRWRDGAADAVAMLEAVLAARPGHPGALRMLRIVGGAPRWAAASSRREE